MAGPAVAEVTDPGRLLEQARLLRAAAADLEERAGQPERSSELTTDWASVLHGDWRAARASAARIALDLRSNRLEAAAASAVEAVSAALLGDVHAASTAAVRAESLGPDDEHVRVGIVVARALVWLSRGDLGVAFDTVLQAIEASPNPADSRALAGMLAESAFHARRMDRARPILVTLHQRVAQATAAEADEARFAEALTSTTDSCQHLSELLANGNVSSPFVRARAHLALGMWLRRHHQPADARRHLQIALDHFESLGAQPWIEPSRNELRATGVRQPPGHEQELSQRQLLIATLAASGFTNREIAQQLFLSPRTVGSHLYRIFPKLGVTTRSQLASGLAAGAAHLAPTERSVAAARYVVPVGTTESLDSARD